MNMRFSASVVTLALVLAPQFVAAAPYISTFTANGVYPLLSINQGDTYTVNWDTQGAIGWCRLYWVGNGPYTPGIYPGDPALTSSWREEPHTSAYGPSGLIGTYTWTCADPAGDVASKQITIKVKLPVITLYANYKGDTSNPLTIPPGASYQVVYGGVNSSACTLSWVPADGSAGGSTQVQPQWSNGATSASGASGLVGTYTYTCTGWNGDFATKTITIRNPDANTDADTLSCSITFDKNPLVSGESTTIHWTSTGAELFYINNVSYVGASGSATVTPDETTDYSGYVNSKADGSGTTAQCSGNTKLTVNEINCPIGYTLQGSACVFDECPVGYVHQGGACVYSACPSGYHLEGSQCAADVHECTPGYYCQGSNLLDSRSGELVEACAWGCFAGACNPIPSPKATLKAVPSLVKRDFTTLVSWSSQYATACTVSGTNGDSWAGLNGSQTSSPIHAQTTYTLNCTGHQGADPSSVQKKAIVNIAPTFEEK